MPEYLAPGVYIEETSFRSKSIEGVSTTTTGFIGPARYGPLDLEPDIVTSLGEFERIYGDRQQMVFDGAGTLPNYLWHAVRAFFEEGGKRLYIARVFKPAKALTPGVGNAQATYVAPPDEIGEETRAKTGKNYDDGHARVWLPNEPADDTSGTRLDKMLVRARFPGAMMDLARVRFTLRVGQNLLGGSDGAPQVSSALLNGDVVWIGKQATAPAPAAAPAPASPPPAGLDPEAAQVEQLNQNFPAEAKRLADVLVKIAESKADALEQQALNTRNDADLMRHSAEAARALADALRKVADQGSNTDLEQAATEAEDNAKQVDAQLLQATQQADQADADANEARNKATELAQQMTLALAGSLPAASRAGVTPLGRLYQARFNAARQRFEFHTDRPSNDVKQISDLVPSQEEVRVVTLTVTLFDSEGTAQVWSDLAFDPAHRRSGVADSVIALFAARPSNLAQARVLPIVLLSGADLDDGLKLLRAMFDSHADIKANLDVELDKLVKQTYEVQATLSGGNDGQRPGSTEYEGQADETANSKTGLKSFEDIEDISIVAAPGCTHGFDNGFGSNAAAINNLLISHAERMRYRIAVLDSGNGQSIAQVRAMRAKLDSKYAALYYPWVRVLDPVTRSEISLPPSGFVAGIYARNDINRAVWKAPANEVVNGALGFEVLLNKAQQDVLNPEGINCFRFFEGRGYRLWGARTISSDPEWKYVNLRRYFIYLERSIDRGTQWAVFEPNGEALWANVRRTIEDFLFNEWQMGALLGDKPEKAYFVRCDRSTMTQNDLDNGRLVCLVGVAPLRPAEFVIFRIGQWTGDRKV